MCLKLYWVVKVIKGWELGIDYLLFFILLGYLTTIIGVYTICITNRKSKLKIIIFYVYINIYLPFFQSFVLDHFFLSTNL